MISAAVGPSMGGTLMDSWGYEKASCILVLMQVLMVSLSVYKLRLYTSIFYDLFMTFRLSIS